MPGKKRNANSSLRGKALQAQSESTYRPIDVPVENLTFYENAWQDDTESAGAFYDVGEAIKGAKTVLIQGWFIEDIPLGEGASNTLTEDTLAKKTSNKHKKQTLAQILMTKAITDPDFKAYLHTWNHMLSPMESDTFNKNLQKAGLEFIQQYREALKSGNIAPQNKISPERLNEIERDLKNHKFPKNIIWRASRGVDGTNLSSRHQKFVVVDAQTTFIGGLDLGSGRSYSASYTIKDEAEPPFRDQYYKIESAAFAADVIDEFAAQFISKTRVNKKKSLLVQGASKISPGGKISHKSLHSDTINRLEFMYHFYLPHLARQQMNEIDNPSSSANGSVQLLRTMPKKLANTVSKKRAFSKDPTAREEVQQRLAWKSANDKETSIQTEYIKAIQGAENFIYIEAQNFTVYDIDDPDYKNHIPIELIKKITEKATNNEPFHVYITMPAFPMLETNDPKAIDSQIISMGQQDAIRSFLKRLEQELPPHAKLDDYVTFCSLTKYEIRDEKELISQVYDHAKMLNVDDEILIVGSANITERSMSGDKDSEIAVKFNGKNSPELKAKIQAQRVRLMESSLGSAFVEERRNAIVTEPNNPELIDAIHKKQRKDTKFLEKIAKGSKKEQPKQSKLLFTYSTYYKHQDSPKYKRSHPKVEAEKVNESTRKVIAKITKKGGY